MADTYDYDMIVIGGGAAGLVAAGLSALLGAKTALVEAHRLGGDCTWTGCIPSKTLLRVAKIAHQMRTADRYGLAATAPHVDFRRVMENVRKTRRQVYEGADAPPHMEKLGVAVVAARARFLDPYTVEVQQARGEPSRLRSRFFVIATGARPLAPASRVRALTNETIFELDEMPRRLLVAGAGPVGVEMSQAFLRLGAKVTMVTPGQRILPRDDPELAGILEQTLKQEGLQLVLGRRVVGIDGNGENTTAILDDGSRLPCDAVLAAMGRKPVVEGLGLEAAGVVVEERGIRIDRHCRTSQRHIFASGDVTGKFLFTHMAEHMSKVAVSNAILRLPASLDEKHVTWCTFSDPELAHVGASERQLQAWGQDYNVYRFPFSRLDRAITEGETIGLVKVFAARGGRILGASILGANAGEMIAEYALAMKHGLSLRKIADTIHPYPTYALGNRRAADEWYLEKLGPGWKRLLRKIFGYRG